MTSDSIYGFVPMEHLEGPNYADEEVVIDDVDEEDYTESSSTLSDSDDNSILERFYPRAPPAPATPRAASENGSMAASLISPMPKASTFQLNYSQSCKVVLLGSSGVGKTQFIAALQAPRDERLDDARQLSLAQPTIGAQFSVVIKPVNGIDVIRTMLWDTAGQERFNVMMPAYVRNANAVLILFDVGSLPSFDDVRTRWLPMVGEEKRENPNCVVALIGNKIDIAQRVVRTRNAEECARSYGCDAYFETSALDRITVHNALEKTINVVHALHRHLNGEAAWSEPHYRQKRACCWK